MKIFISWSGRISHEIALTLRDWLPLVIQALRPFVSSGDIKKVMRWSDAVASELQNTKAGIICLTPYNFKAPWLNFEAGALSREVSHSFLSPFLFRIKPLDLHGPLSQFQSTTCEKDDVYRLLSSLNEMVGDESRVSAELLTLTFETFWPRLDKKLHEIGEMQENETQTGYDWLFAPYDLQGIELHAAIKAITVVTPSPYQDLTSTCIKGLILQNIGRGINYKFLVPKSGATEELINSLTKIFVSHPELLKIISIPDKEFHRLAVTHYVIMNPEDESEFPLQVFIELPIVQRDYWVEVNSDAAYDFRDRFDALERELPLLP